MTEHVCVEVVDDAATLDEASSFSRAEFLSRSLAAGGIVVAGGVVLAGLPRLSAAAPPSASMDLRILNFFLLLERLQEAFYARALDEGALTGAAAEVAETVAEHEQAHVAFLEELLGDDADGAPSFDFGDSTSDNDRFMAAALMLEETTAAAYIGQGANLTIDKILAAARIVSVEARHAAWLRDLLGKKPAPRAADQAKTEKQVNAAIEATGFVK
ncbi:MAG: ferritin-like domain-containing protein [Actinomycetota bacterium]